MFGTWEIQAETGRTTALLLSFNQLVSALSCYSLTEALILVLLAFLCFADHLAQVIGSPTIIMFGLGFLSVDASSGFIYVFVLAFTCGCGMS
jgi:hypothetical protein